MRRQRLHDDTLRDAVFRIDSGLAEADLGCHLFKVRVARQGSGRSGGFRYLVVYRAASRAVFVYGFAKSEQETLSPGELAGYKLAAGDYLALTEEELSRLVASGTLMEVDRDDQTA